MRRYSSAIIQILASHAERSQAYGTSNALAILATALPIPRHPGLTIDRAIYPQQKYPFIFRLYSAVLTGRNTLWPFVGVAFYEIVLTLQVVIVDNAVFEIKSVQTPPSGQGNVRIVGFPLKDHRCGTCYITQFLRFCTNARMIGDPDETVFQTVYQVAGWYCLLPEAGNRSQLKA